MKSPLLLFAGAFTCVILGSASGCSETEISSETAQNQVNDAALVQEETPEVEQPMEYLNARVKIETSFGDIVVQLFDETPKHRDNFIKLVEEGYYDSLLFHRVMQNFMIQGGDPDSRGASQNVMLGRGGPGYTVEAEFNDSHVHVKGALAAARQSDQVNPQRRSSGSQFYIVQGEPVPPQMLMGMEGRINASRDSLNQFKYTDEQIEAYTSIGGTPHLDTEYTVFGRVVEGLDVIDSIAAVKVARGNRPVEDVIMKMEVLK